MKKLRFLFLILLICMPIYVSAYGIENYYIDAIIEDNGDLLVQEYFNMTGEYNGFERIIEHINEDAYEFNPNLPSFGGSSIHNGDGLEILEVRAVSVDDAFDFKNIGGEKFTKVSSASKGNYGVYTESVYDNGKTILIYNPSSKNKAFYIKYRISNMAIKHNDVAEIGWNVVGDRLSESIGNLKVYLHLPGNTSVKAWAHGPLNGTISIINNELVMATISGLSGYRAVDVRATFDLNVINKSSKTTNTDALDKIILYETDKAEQANYERKNQELLKQQSALEAINEFEVYVRRYYYEAALDKVNEITDVTVKNQYMERLNKLKVILDVKEEEEARESLSTAQRYINYDYYIFAKKNIEILDNDEIRSELLEELALVEEKVKNAELKSEKYSYIYGFILVIVIACVGITIYLKYRKDPKVDFDHEYLREIPGDYSPETVSYLFYKKIVGNALSASMLDLVRKKIMFVEKINSSNYRLTMNKEYTEQLTNTEERLVKLIFHNEDSVETKHMKKYAKNNYDSFISSWNAYHKAVLNNAKRECFYETDSTDKGKEKTSNKGFISIYIMIALFVIVPYLAIFILFGYGVYKIIKFIIKYVKYGIENFNGFKVNKLFFFICIIAFMYLSISQFIFILVSHHYYKTSSIIFIACFISCICLIVLLFNRKKRTYKGALEFKKWNALKKYLNNFGKFDDKEAMEIVLWEKYLVFATLFGCAKKVVQHMKIQMVNMPNDYFDSYLEVYNMNRYITASLRHSYVSAHNAYTAAHSSSDSGGFSSSGGGGGGFSSGGGSFGGGGGGGRF